MRVGWMSPAAAASTVPLEGNFRKWPDDCGGDGGEGFAALDELMEDVVVGGMSDERVNGNGFGQSGEIAHGKSPPGRYSTIVAERGGRVCAEGHRAGVAG